MIEEQTNSIVIRDVDFSSSQYKKFERAFSVYNNVTHKYDYNIYKIINNDIHIPATVTPSLVQTYFTNDVIVKNYTMFPKGKKISFGMVHEPKDDKQREALAFLQSMLNDKYKKRMLNLATGSGKTYVSIAALSSIGLRSMIIVDTIDLANQWANQIKYHTDLTDADIFIISGKESIEEAKKGDYKIFIALHMTLTLLLDADVNSVNEMNFNLGIGVRVFDECHVNFHNICMINALSNVEYSIFLTATPKRSDYKEDSLYSKVFNSVPSYNGKKATDEKYHTVVLTYFDSHPKEKQKASVKTKYGFSLSRWAGFIESDECYNYFKESLTTILTKFKLVENGRKIAIILPKISLINKIFMDLINEFSDVDIGLFIGDTKPSERANELKKQIILTNQKIFGKAIDIPDLDCVISYVPLSSQVNVEQILGRLRNNKGHTHILIDVTDIGYDECINQLKIRKRVYKKLVKEIKNIEFKNESNEKGDKE